MEANPGGYIPPDEVIGRDKLVQRLWRILERQSLVLCAERRIGKTCIIRKMIAEPPQERLLLLYRDLEKVHTTLEFVETVFGDVKSYLGSVRQTVEWMRRLLTRLSGTEVRLSVEEFNVGFNFPDAVAQHWEIMLAKTIEALVKHQKNTVILFWDEVPLMLDNIKKHEDEKKAMEVLDTLRALRQTHPNLRMVFTGSIGLHNVITSLKRAGYSNAPTNDMHTEDVPPLSLFDAQELTRRLLEGEGIPTDNLQATTKKIAVAVDCIPYYIHHVVDQMTYRGGEASVAIVDEIVNDCLTAPLDCWNLHHYRERIDTYYTPEEKPFALGLLDALAASDQPLPFDALFNLLKSHMATEDSEMVRSMLTLLQRDHYIIQQTNGKYRFRFPLIQRWWCLDRGLCHER